MSPHEPWRIGTVELTGVARLPPGPDARLPAQRERDEPLLPARPRARARSGPGQQPCGLDLRTRARPRRLALIHDGQYTEREYRAHRAWGHSSLPDALVFAERSEVQRLVLTHHDPWHDDDLLERLEREVWERWAHLDGEARVRLGREGYVLDLAAADPFVQPAGLPRSSLGAFGRPNMDVCAHGPAGVGARR